MDYDLILGALLGLVILGVGYFILAYERKGLRELKLQRHKWEEDKAVSELERTAREQLRFDRLEDRIERVAQIEPEEWVPPQVFVNGQLMSEGDGNDYTGNSDTGELRFEFALHDRDVIQIIRHNGTRETRSGSEALSNRDDPGFRSVLWLDEPPAMSPALNIPKEPEPPPTPPRTRWERLNADDDDFDLPT